MKFSACLVAVLLAVVSPAHAAMNGEVPAGAKLQDMTMQGLNGPTRKIGHFRGRPLIINVWASWCAPCRAEMGSLDRLAKRYGKQFAVIGISTDDYPNNAKEFLLRSGTAFPMFIDSPPWPLEHMLGANRLPLTVLVDAEGKVISKHYGARAWDAPESVSLIAQAFKLKL